VHLAHHQIKIERDLSIQELQESLNLLEEYNGFKYGIVVFKDIPNMSQTDILKKNGIELLDYLPDYGYFAKVSPKTSLSEDFNIRAFVRIQAKDRLHADLLQNPFPEHAIEGNFLLVNIVPISKESELWLQEEINSRFGLVTRVETHTRWLQCKIKQDKLFELASLPVVQFIEPIDAPGFPENYRGRASHRVASLTQGITGLPKELDGSGMNVMLQDDGVIGPHIDYQGRIGGQFIATDRGDHGDHTGGTIMGAGNLNPRYAGMAPAATIWVYGAAFEGYPGFDSIYTHYNKYGIRITSTSYSNGTNAGYTSLARKLDDQIEQMNDLTHVFSAGNAGSNFYTITGGHKVAKNVVTVANLTHLDVVNNSSSRGPARDGRIKPEVGAVGTQVMSTINNNGYDRKTGTSMSCPGVAGTMTVLYQAYKEHNAGANPNSALMRGIVCNTADDLGNPGPDFSYGYGRVNARKAYEVIKNKTYVLDTVTNGSTKNHSISIPQNTSLLKVMIVWLDPKGTIGSSKPLVNNLDMEVRDPNLGVFQPYVLNPSSPNSNATTGVDNINNIEQVVIRNPANGNYSISIKGSTVVGSGQPYYLIYYMELDEVIVEYPVGGETFNPGETEVIRWSAPANSGPYDVEFSSDSGQTWSTLANAVNGHLYSWTIPNTRTAGGRIRVVGNSSIGVSPDNFSILGVSAAPFARKACPDTLTLGWNPISGASHYTIYTLGQTYMDSIGTSNTNSFNLSGNCKGYEPGWFAVSAHGINGETGRRSEAFWFDGQLKNCSRQHDMNLVKFSPELSVVKSCMHSKGLPVQVEVENQGSAASTPFNLYLSLNGAPPVQQAYTLSIAPGTSTQVKFQQNISLSSGSNSLKVWLAGSSSDENPCNDTLVSTVFWSDEQPNGSCFKTDFENFLNCGTGSDCELEQCSLVDNWLNEKNGVVDDIDWRVHNGQTPTRNTGPLRDHTSNTPPGKYVYLESSGGCTQQEAHLVSPCIDLSGAIKPILKFWYHMYGTNMGSLAVDVFSNGNWIKDVVSPLSGNKGNSWYEQTVDLSAYKGQVILVRLRGETGNGFYSDIAIDDISFTDQVKADFAINAQGFNASFVNTSSGAQSANWDFGDGNTSTDYSPNHIYNSPGSYSVRLIISGPCGADTVIKQIEVVSIAQYGQNEFNLKVFPQPAKEAVTVTSDYNLTQIRLLDLSGKQVFKSRDIQNQIQFSVAEIPSGIYVLEVYSGDVVQRRRLSVQH
jgi:PKD repeat protein